MPRFLVTGAGGFIGSEITRALASRGDEVWAFDIAQRPALKDIAGRFPSVRPVCGEMTEWSHLMQALRDAQPDAVIHCAAIVGVAASAGAPLTTFRVNVEGALHLMEAMRMLGVRRLVNLSTEEVYGHFLSDLITEDHPCLPLMPYGISKFAVEQLARDYVRLHGLQCIHLRTCWVYGPGLPRPRIPKTLIDAAVAGEPLHLAAGGDFRVDHLYIDDLVAGVLAALDKTDHRFDAYHIASGTAPSLAEIVALLKELVPGAQLSVGPGAYRFADNLAVVRKGALDIRRARAELGYAPRYDIRSGLAACVNAQRGGAA
jgi:UDP-glucose 4-epimerase